MKRRAFINATLASGAALSLPGAAAGASRKKPPDIAAVRLSGEATVLAASSLKDLAGRLKGTLVLADVLGTVKAREGDVVGIAGSSTGDGSWVACGDITVTGTSKPRAPNE